MAAKIQCGIETHYIQTTFLVTLKSIRKVSLLLFASIRFIPQLFEPSESSMNEHCNLFDVGLLRSWAQNHKTFWSSKSERQKSWKTKLLERVKIIFCDQNSFLADNSGLDVRSASRDLMNNWFGRSRNPVRVSLLRHNYKFSKLGLIS